MENLAVNIVLPAGLALADGSTLQEDASLTVVGTLTPWYSTIDLARLEGGIYLVKVPDLTLAAQVWQASQDADAITFHYPEPPQDGSDIRTDVGARKWKLFNHARQQYVSIKAARDLVLNVFDLAGVKGTRTLGNLSIGRQAFAREEGLPKKLSDMEKEIKYWSVVVQAGGEIGPGGHAKPGFAAKGMYDPSDSPSGRLWSTTGMGANKKTWPGYGSAGKPVKYGSPPFTQWRVGRNFGNYVSMFPNVIWQ